MTLTAYPIALLARKDFFRVLKTRWDQECKDFVIERMKASSSNIKPVIVLDDITKTSECYLINNTFTDFELKSGLEADKMCRRVESIADWFINKVRIQKSNLSRDDKEEAVDIYLKRDANHKTLTLEETNRLRQIENKIR